MKPPYYKVRRGRAFFELGRERGARAGLASSTPLGPDGDRARAAAAKLYADWREATFRADPAPDKAAWPAGSLGHWFTAYREGAAWRLKAAATRQEWENMWRFIGPELGETPIRRITPGAFAEFQLGLEASRGAKTRWRAVKVARALFRAAVNNHVLDRSPANPLPNPIPAGRTDIWLAAEIVRLMTAADALARPAMKLAVWIAWQTLFQPGDVRQLTLANRHRSAAGAYVVIRRGKTGREAFGAVSHDLDAAIDAYVASLPVTLLPDQPFLRTTRGHQYLKARFLDDFAAVRRAAFGSEERRRFQDIRRSGNVEADLADASPEDRAEILANNLHKDRFLEATYTPPTVAKARAIAGKRLIGRRMLAAHCVNATGGESEQATEE